MPQTNELRELKQHTDILRRIEKEAKTQTKALEQLTFTLLEIGLILKHVEKLLEPQNIITLPRGEQT